MPELDIKSILPVPARTKKTLIVIAPEAFQPTRVKILGTPSDWILHDLRINDRSQFTMPGDLPGDVFALSAADGFLHFDHCPAGSAVEIDISYVGSLDKNVFAAQLEDKPTPADTTNGKYLVT